MIGRIILIALAAGQTALAVFNLFTQPALIVLTGPCAIVLAIVAWRIWHEPDLFIRKDWTP